MRWRLVAPLWGRKIFGLILGIWNIHMLRKIRQVRRYHLGGIKVLLIAVMSVRGQKGGKSNLVIRTMRPPPYRW